MKASIQQYDFKKGLPQELELVAFEQLLSNASDELTTPHRTDFYQILWFQSGTPTHLVDFNPVAITPNTLVFINKNCVQLFDSQTPFTGQSILFTDTFFCKTEADTQFLQSSILFNDLLSVSYINIPDANATIASAFQQIALELQQPKDDFQADILRNDLHNLLLHSERERRNQDFIELKKDADLSYALDLKNLLDLHFTKQKKVSFYAEELHISAKRLNQTTTKIFGKSAKSIIDDRILLECKRLLTHTNDSIKEIAYTLGFEEPTNFIKYFKKHTNNTPLAFREKYRLA